MPTVAVRVSNNDGRARSAFVGLLITAHPALNFPTLPSPRELPISIAREITLAGGWLSFDQFMHLALYTPAMGYYSRNSPKFGAWPETGSDFVTAPEISPLFGHALAQQIAQSLNTYSTPQVWEFGAGTGALAEQLLDQLENLGQSIERYTIIDVSGALRDRQQHRLARFGSRVQWLSALPAALSGVIVGNEVLDAMPVKLLRRHQGQWLERGVVLAAPASSNPDLPIFDWEDRPTPLRPPIDIAGDHDYVTEIHPQAQAFIATVADGLKAGSGGAAYFIDYGFPEAEYWLPERSAGTLMCHRAQRIDADPLTDVGEKDITAHVDFTGIALTAQNAALEILGYTGQGRFLINCGIAQLMQNADLPTRATAMKLLAEHEMGELFKVIGIATPGHAPALGFAVGDRMHRL